MLSNDYSTIFIVEDDEAVCEVITHLLNSVGLSVKSFGSPHAFLEYFNVSFKGCLVLDIRMPGMNGLDLYETLKRRHSTLPVIFLTGYPDIPMAVRAIKAGAFDYIVKPFNNQLFLDQIQKAIAQSHEHHCTQQSFLECIATLTRRENEVLQCVVEGKLNKQIAAKLGIAISTVEKHRANIMQKTQTRSVAELVRRHVLIAQKSHDFL